MTTDLRRKLLRLFVNTEGEIVFQQVMASLAADAMIVDRSSFSLVMGVLIDDGILIKRTVIEHRRVCHYYQMNPLQRLAAI